MNTSINATKCFRMEVLHKVNELVKEWIKDVGREKVCHKII